MQVIDIFRLSAPTSLSFAFSDDLFGRFLRQFGSSRWRSPFIGQSETALRTLRVGPSSRSPKLAASARPLKITSFEDLVEVWFVTADVA